MTLTPPAHWRLSYALPLALGLLIAANTSAREDPGIQVQVLAKSGSSWDGSALPNYPQGTPEISILKIAIPPGMRLPTHEHPVINAGYLLSGRLKVVTEDGHTLVLNAGDSLVEVVEKWHYGINEGTEPAVILVFYAGVVDTPISVKR
jgi:quercetin dioxygenase-like cupin family protein